MVVSMSSSGCYDRRSTYVQDDRYGVPNQEAMAPSRGFATLSLGFALGPVWRWTETQWAQGVAYW